MTDQRTPTATDDDGATAKGALERIGVYLAKCSDDFDDLVTACSEHPITVGDLWALYCAKQPAANNAGSRAVNDD